MPTHRKPGPEPLPHVRSGPPLSRRDVLALTALAMAGPPVLAACGSTAETSVGASASGGGPGADGVTVTDQRGATITLSAPAARIVTLPMPAAALLVAVDQSADHLVGMHDVSWIAMRDGIMGEMFPEALDIAHEVADPAFAPNVESIVALEPDVVVQWGGMGEDLIAPMENAGLQVLGLALGDQEDVATWITLFSQILGKPERGEELNARFDAQLEEARALGAARETRPRILYFNRFEGLRVAGEQTYNDFYIDLIGGRNVATGDGGVPGSGMVDVDTEQVLAWDPDIILLGNFDGAMPEDLYTDPVWGELAAVRSRQVYKVPLGGYRWDPPSQESPLMWSWLAALAFPGEESTLRADIADHYEAVYGQVPTQTQIDTMLWTEGNAASAHYEQFDAS